MQEYLGTKIGHTKVGTLCWYLSDNVVYKQHPNSNPKIKIATLRKKHGSSTFIKKDKRKTTTQISFKLMAVKKDDCYRLEIRF